MIQRIAETRLAEAVEAHRAVGGWIVVVDPRTGDVLAAHDILDNAEARRALERAFHLDPRDRHVLVFYGDVLSAEPGHVLPFITQGERFQVCRIAEKREPALSDASVCARVDADLRTGHFGNLAANHIVSAVAPPSAP